MIGDDQQRAGVDRRAGRAHAHAEQAADEAMIENRNAPPQRTLERDRKPLHRHQRKRDQCKHQKNDDHAQHQRLDLLVVQRHGIKLEPVIDQLVAELAGDLALQPLDLLGLELDHLAAAQVDQVVVVRFRNLLVARAALAEIVARR